jgi:hypothetical protein
VEAGHMLDIAVARCDGLAAVQATLGAAITAFVVL